MEKIDFITNAILIKSRKRFEKSSYSTKFLIDQPFNEDGFIFKGLFRDNRNWVLEKNGEYFMFPINQSSPLIKTSKEIKNTPTKELKKIELIEVSDFFYNDDIFKPMKTGTPIDHMFSTDGGIYPATNYMIIGDPGIGKSTQTLDILSKIKENDPTKKVLFISAEMNQIDMYGYVKRYPSFGRIPTLFLCDYIDEDPKSIIERTYQQGFDIILIDSFIEVQESVQSTTGMNRTQAEKWMIDLMIHHNKGNNDRNKYTSFLVIQQVTKGGNFVGSNKLKHNTTGMIELRYSSEFSGDRYAKVTKNRRGFLYEKIYFSLEGKNSVEYDEKRLKRDTEIKSRLQKEKEILLSEEEQFNKIFGIQNNSFENTEDQFSD